MLLTPDREPKMPREIKQTNPDMLVLPGGALMLQNAKWKNTMSVNEIEILSRGIPFRGARRAQRSKTVVTCHQHEGRLQESARVCISPYVDITGSRSRDESEIGRDDIQLRAQVLLVLPKLHHLAEPPGLLVLRVLGFIGVLGLRSLFDRELALFSKRAAHES